MPNILLPGKFSGLNFEAEVIVFNAMKPLRILLPLVVACLFASSSALAQSFTVSFPKERSAKPLDGRLYLLLSTDDSAEPRMQISGDTNTQLIFGVNVDGLAPDAGATVDAKAFGYPIRSLKDVPPGEYTVQALLSLYETFHRSDGSVVKLHMDQGEGQHWNVTPGNIYSKPRKITVNTRRCVDCDFDDGSDSADCGEAGHEVCAADQDPE